LAKTTRRLLVLDIAAWALAAVPAVVFLINLPLQRGPLFWGFWLFIGLAAAMLLFGAWALTRNRRAEPLLSAPD